MTPKLSILIPTVVGREEQVTRLENKLCLLIKPHTGFIRTINTIYGCFNNDVEIIFFKDNKEMTIGEKRELLYKEANGLYSLQIDDDDDIADNGIELILDAIKNNPGVDCITYRENCMMNGKYYSSNHSLKYDDWADKFDGFDYVRTPFYKDVIRTDIAKSVPFEHIRYGEDHAWARTLKPHLKTEAHIDEEIYFYIHNSTPEKHNERYGIN